MLWAELAQVHIVTPSFPFFLFPVVLILCSVSLVASSGFVIVYFY